MKELLPIILLLSACVTTKWAHKSLGEQELDRDRSACQAEGRQQRGDNSYGLGRAVGMGTGVEKLKFEECMKGKGWEKR